jgi:hypothetical protein
LEAPRDRDGAARYKLIVSGPVTTTSKKFDGWTLMQYGMGDEAADNEIKYGSMAMWRKGQGKILAVWIEVAIASACGIKQFDDGVDERTRG